MSSLDLYGLKMKEKEDVKIFISYTSEPNMYFCNINKTKKEVTLGEGTVMPFKSKVIKLENFIVEELIHFSENNKIQMRRYVDA